MAMQCHHGDHSDELTPPNIFVKAPLTPPSTDAIPTEPVLKIFRLIQDCKDGRPVSEREWHTFKLHHCEYRQLLFLLKNEESLWTFVETKLRYDYDSWTQTFVLRMPTLLHDFFIQRVVDEIHSQLHSFKNVEGSPRAFVQKIRHTGTGRLELSSEIANDGTSIKREPDASFTHDDALWPGVIIEASYSQKAKAMPHLADDYILETNGSVQVVVGLDVDYGTKRGTVSLWRPRYKRNEQGRLELEAAQVLNGQVFRDESGGPNLSEDAGLRLELEAFAPESIARGVHGSIFINAASLCRCLEEAERRQERIKQRRGVVNDLIAGAKIRRRENTPTEEINSDDERRYEEEERRVEERELAENSSYQSSQS